MLEEPEADVVVVGSGPSGAVVTQKLAERGLKVVCLEQGDWVNSSDFPANNPQWELQIQNQWAHDPNVRKLPSDYPLGVDDSDMWPVMFNAVGGSSILYGGHWVRLLPSDFRAKTIDGVADDWPISYEDLVPYYDEVGKFIGASGLAGDPAYPPGLDYELPPHPLGAVGRKAAESANKLGWHWWPGAHSIASQKFKTLMQCARWGTCEWGCPEGAKASFDIAYWPHALRSGATLVTGARVLKVEVGSDGLANGVTWIDRAGGEHRQRANAVVMCANSIGTARTLLLSASSTCPNGLANSSGFVGKNLMLHPNSTVAGYYDEDLKSWRGPAGQLIRSMEFYETRPEHDFVAGMMFMVLPTPGPLNAIESHRPLGYDAVWGDNFLRIAASHRSGVFWCANTNDLPEESNYVGLDPKLVDDSGIPAPSIHYRISDNTRSQLKFAIDRMQELHTAGGAVRTIPVDLWVDQPGHLMGTARMGNDPARSVTNSFGQTHDVSNLFIADGSLFVTAGAVNPTCTIAALALRVGTHIADTAKDRKVLA